MELTAQKDCIPVVHLRVDRGICVKVAATQIHGGSVLRHGRIARSQGSLLCAFRLGGNVVSCGRFVRMMRIE